jgi:transposase
LTVSWRDDGGMTATEMEVPTTGLVDTKGCLDGRKRRQWLEALKRQIVAESLAPGASVSIVARRHDVNANQLFKWRRAIASQPPLGADETCRMVPVRIVREAGEPRAPARRSVTIEIVFADGARVYVRGEVSPQTLRQVIELLR